MGRPIPFFVGVSTETFLTLGTEIVVTGYQSKDRLCEPTCRANGRDITFPDGRKLFMGSSGTGAAARRFGYYRTIVTSVI